MPRHERQNTMQDAPLQQARVRFQALLETLARMVYLAAQQQHHMARKGHAMIAIILKLAMFLGLLFLGLAVVIWLGLIVIGMCAYVRDIKRRRRAVAARATTPAPLTQEDLARKLLEDAFRPPNYIHMDCPPDTSISEAADAFLHWDYQHRQER